MKPNVINGNIFEDQRGIIRHINDFKLKNICRFYTIEHLDTKSIRAWQGHQVETKYFVPIKGSFVVAWVKIDHFKNPSSQLKADYKILNQDQPLVLNIPSGYANGLKALQPNSVIGVFSEMENEKSLIETIRYPSEWWFDWSQDFKVDR